MVSASDFMVVKPVADVAVEDVVEEEEEEVVAVVDDVGPITLVLSCLQGVKSTSILSLSSENKYK